MHEITFYSLCMINFDLIVKTIITKERKAHAYRNAEKLINATVSKQHILSSKYAAVGNIPR